MTRPPIAKGFTTQSVPVQNGLVASAPVASATSALQDDPASGRRVSLDFVAADINDVLKALSLQSGINIVTGNDVKGNVTVSLKRVSLTEALDMVTRLSGYTYARFGSAYVVGTPTTVGTLTARNEQPAENVTEFIPYRYNSTAVLYRALLDKFPGLKLPESDKADVNAGPRMLVLTDSPKRAGEVREFVARLEQAASIPTAGGVTEVYQVRYASPYDLINLIGRLVPSVSVQAGPSQGFQPDVLGGSASFSASSSPAGGAAPNAGAPGSATPTTAQGAGTNTGAAGAQAGGQGVANTPARMPTSLLLTGTAGDIARARELLAQLDVRTPQIVYEAKVVDISTEDISRLGLTYDFSRLVGIGENNETGTPGNVGATPNPARNPQFGTIFRSPYSINVQLDAALNNNRNRLLASPNLSALDGQPAIVFIGDQIKYVINVQQTPVGQTIQTETATVGITLKVTGKTSPDGTITLYVHPEVSAVRDFLNVGNGISLPQIATRFVDTTVRVRDGETIAIGGLLREQDINNLQKVPILGDLPFFGRLLFTRQIKNRANSNLIVFITSRIVRD
jgi:type II secretory pathway component GspD/PulD (secretin)